MLNKNAIHNLNSIIYTIYNTLDFDEMRRMVAASIRALIPCTCVNIMMADAADSRHRLYAPVCFPERYQRMGEKYIMMQEDDYSLWVLNRKQSKVIRDTDLMYEDEWMETALYRNCFGEFGIHYTIDLTITDGQNLIGVMSLYRSKEEGDFSEDDVFFLELISEHLNMRFADKDRGSIKSMQHKIAAFVRDYGLTQREAEILQMIFDGKNNVEISSKLCISENTLKKHLQNLYRKTGSMNRVQLAVLQEK